MEDVSPDDISSGTDWSVLMESFKSRKVSDESHFRQILGL